MSTNGIKFLDNLIPDRIRISQEDKDPIHVYEVLSKNLGESIDDLKNKYNVQMDVIRSQIFISGNYGDIYELFIYMYSRGVEFESIQHDSLRVDLIKFFNKIY